MPDDKDKPQVTQSSNSNELTAARDGAWSLLDGKPLWSPPWREHAPQQRDRYPWQDLAEVAETTHRTDTTEPVVEKAAMPASESANPMHPRDRRFYLAVALGTIAAGLAVSCFLAAASGQLAWTWAIGGIVVGLLVAVLAAFDALEKRVLLFRHTWPITIGLAALTWLLIGWQTWTVFHMPLETAISQAKAPLQSKLDDAIKQRDAARLEAQTVRVWSPKPSSQDYPQALGTTCAYNLLSAATAFWSGAPRGTAVLITGARENDQLMHNLSAAFSLGSTELKKSTKIDYPVIMDGPNNSVDKDAPRLIPTDQNGIIIHGSDPQDTLKTRWSYHFLVRRTSKVPDGLAEYYKVPSIVWIEI